MEGRYWVYVNHPTDKALVHEAGCSFCNDGRGMVEDKSRFNGEWHGPYDEPGAALRKARGTGKSTVRWCGHCARSRRG